MRFNTLLVLTAFVTSFAIAQETEAVVENDVPDIQVPLQEEKPEAPARLQVAVTCAFRDAEVFGVKLVNGQPLEAKLTYKNDEPKPVSVGFVGGRLWDDSNPKGSQIIRNLTFVRPGITIAGKESKEFIYRLITETQPKELRLELQSVLHTPEGNLYTLESFNGTVTVVDPDISLLDPQIIFLYFFLGALFVGTIYFIYKTWITALFPQKRRGGKGGEKPKKSLGQAKKADPTDQASAGSDGPAVTTSAKAYDESWIPAQHLQRPEARRVKSGARSKPRSKAE